MTIPLYAIGKYSNGAYKIKAHGMIYTHWVAFEDCEECQGKGYTRKYTRMSPYGYEIQCQTCHVRFGSKESIKERINQILDQTESDMRKAAKELQVSFAKSKPLTGAARKWADNLTFSEIGQEYRQLLVKYWTYEEPAIEYFPLEG